MLRIAPTDTVAGPGSRQPYDLSSNGLLVAEQATQCDSTSLEVPDDVESEGEKPRS